VAIINGQKHIALLPPHGEQELNITDREKQILVSSDPLPIAGISKKKVTYLLKDPENLILDLNKRNEPDAILMHQHPVYSTAKSLVYSPLQRGEMAFIPKLWYHYIHNVDFSVSLTIQTMRN
jgi:hypothetical protein